jgi:hypothetical protein
MLHFLRKLSSKLNERKFQAQNEKLNEESKAVQDHSNQSPHIICPKCNNDGHYANMFPESYHVGSKNHIK